MKIFALAVVLLMDGCKVKEVAPQPSDEKAFAYARSHHCKPIFYTERINKFSYEKGTVDGLTPARTLYECKNPDVDLLIEESH